MIPGAAAAAADLLQPVVFASLAVAWVPAALLAAASQEPPEGPAPRLLAGRASRALALAGLGLSVVAVQVAAVLVLIVGGGSMELEPLAWPLLSASAVAAALLAARAVPVLHRQGAGTPELDPLRHGRAVAAARAAGVAACACALLVVLTSGAPSAPVGASVLPVVAGAGLVWASYGVLLRSPLARTGTAVIASPSVCHDAGHAPGPRLVRR